MGILLPHADGLAVYEAVGPVKFTPFAEWKARGVDGRLLVKRLRRPDGALKAEEIRKLVAVAATYLGKTYDSHFGWSDERIYCSELVWKMYKGALGIELGSLERLGDFDLTHPSVVVPLQERYRGSIPRDEPVISPAAMEASPWLETVEIL
jgi:hypothetical protein